MPANEEHTAATQTKGKPHWGTATATSKALTQVRRVGVGENLVTESLLQARKREMCPGWPKGIFELLTKIFLPFITCFFLPIRV